MSLSAKKVPELKAMAKAKKIKGFSKMRKAELIAALGGSAPASKEVKPPKKKIVKSSVRAAAAADRVAQAKKAKGKVVSKIRQTDKKARLAELRKLKPKYPPPPPPTAKTLYDFDPTEQTMYKNKKIKLQKLKQEKESRTKNIEALRKKKDETALEEQKQTNKKKGIPAPKYIRDRANDASQSFSFNSAQIKLIQRDINALEKQIKKMEVDEPQQRKQYEEFEKKIKSKKAESVKKPLKKKVVKKGKKPIVFDLSKPIKPQKGQDFQINDPKKQIKLKSRRGKYRKGEDEPENKNLDYAALNKKLKL